MAQRVLACHYRPEGRRPDEPYKINPLPCVNPAREATELCIAANFVEVFLAREGHSNPVGINYLEKIQFPHLPSLYGAMLAGVAVVIIGAGLPLEIPASLDALVRHCPATYSVRMAGHAGNKPYQMTFDPSEFAESTVSITRPLFLPIVSSDALAAILRRRLGDGIDGFVVEGPLAGGHNAPPRGALSLTADGEPVYGPRDIVNIDQMRALGLPFWLAGAYGSPEGLRSAIAAGAAGIQVGTAFALCVESGLLPEIRRALVLQALRGQHRVFTDPIASPTGFPFKIAQMEGTLSEAAVYEQRNRVCDLGFLREAYRRNDGTVGYRCPAEPTAAFVAKGGAEADTVGRKCLCNALVANIGMPQRLPDGGQERCLITLGDDFSQIGRFCTADRPDFRAEDVIRILLECTPA